jgi:sugar phosphate isomerase/epimerase
MAMSLISRRQVMALMGGAGVAAMLPRAMWADPLGLPIGIQLYMVSKPLNENAPGTLKKLYEIGYREVETAGTAKYSAAEFAKLITDAGLKCPSVHLQVKDDDFDSALADAKALGAHYAVNSLMRIPPPGGKLRADGKLGMDGFQRLADRLNELGTKAKAIGLQYAYHNHNMEFEKLPDGTPGYDLLVTKTDPELVKFEIDCGWMTVANANPVEYFKKYPGRFKMLHIKDFQPLSGNGKGDEGVRPQGADAGTGFVKYGPIFEGAKGVGIEHIFAEQEAPFPVSQMDSAKVDYAYIAKFK